MFRTRKLDVNKSDLPAYQFHCCSWSGRSVNASWILPSISIPSVNKSRRANTTWLLKETDLLSGSLWFPHLAVVLKMLGKSLSSLCWWWGSEAFSPQIRVPELNSCRLELEKFLLSLKIFYFIAELMEFLRYWMSVELFGSDLHCSKCLDLLYQAHFSGHPSVSISASSLLF